MLSTVHATTGDDPEDPSEKMDGRTQAWERRVTSPARTHLVGIGPWMEEVDDTASTVGPARREMMGEVVFAVRQLQLQ